MERDELTSVPVEKYRLLRRLDLTAGPVGKGGPVANFGVVVGVATSGIDQANDVVIELAARRFAFDAENVITHLDRPYSWREDPGRPLAPEVSRLTGLRDEDLARQAIDVEVASRVIGSAAIRIAHGARFQRPLVEEILPALAPRPWGCSLEDVQWGSYGFEGTRLKDLLSAFGYFSDPHRGQSDVDATIAILRHEVAPGVTALGALMRSAEAESWLVRAFGAAYEKKDLLRGRGYRWNALQRVWWREVRDREAEKNWLAGHVYVARSRARGAPHFERIDWTTRYA